MLIDRELMKQYWEEMKSRTWMLNTYDVQEYSEWNINMRYGDDSSIMWYFICGDPDADEEMEYDAVGKDVRHSYFAELIESKKFNIEDVDEDTSDGFLITFRKPKDVLAFVKYHGIKIELLCSDHMSEIMAFMKELEDAN